MQDKDARTVFEIKLLPHRLRFETLIFMALLCLPILTCVTSATLRLERDLVMTLTCITFAFPFVLQVVMNLARWRLRLGDDGISVRRFGREHFIPWKDFLSFEKSTRGILAKTRSGDVRLGRPHPNHTHVGSVKIFQKLKALADELRVEREAPRALPFLEGHAEKQWPELLKRAAQGDFRKSGITQTHLLEDLLNPDTPPALRELVAKTLKVRVEDADLQQTIEVFASERSKKALQSLLKK